MQATRACAPWLAVHYAAPNTLCRSANKVKNQKSSTNKHTAQNTTHVLDARHRLPHFSDAAGVRHPLAAGAVQLLLRMQPRPLLEQHKPARCTAAQQMTRPPSSRGWLRQDIHAATKAVFAATLAASSGRAAAAAHRRSRAPQLVEVIPALLPQVPRLPATPCSTAAAAGRPSGGHVPHSSPAGGGGRRRQQRRRRGQDPNRSAPVDGSFSSSLGGSTMSSSRPRREVEVCRAAPQRCSSVGSEACSGRNSAMAACRCRWMRARAAGRSGQAGRASGVQAGGQRAAQLKRRNACVIRHTAVAPHRCTKRGCMRNAMSATPVCPSHRRPTRPGSQSRVSIVRQQKPAAMQALASRSGCLPAAGQSARGGQQASVVPPCSPAARRAARPARQQRQRHAAAAAATENAPSGAGGHTRHGRIGGDRPQPAGQPGAALP